MYFMRTVEAYLHLIHKRHFPDIYKTVFQINI